MYPDTATLGTLFVTYLPCRLLSTVIGVFSLFTADTGHQSSLLSAAMVADILLYY